MVWTTHPHLALKLKKEWSYTSTPPLGLCGLFQDELYLFTFTFRTIFSRSSLPSLNPTVFHIDSFVIWGWPVSGHSTKAVKSHPTQRIKTKRFVCKVNQLDRLTSV